MLRRVTSILLLTALFTHCAGRLGVLSYMYEKRHDIAFTIGFIAESPIALCSADYDFDPGIKIVDHDQTAPLIHAQEIVLFYEPVPQDDLPEFSFLRKVSETKNHEIDDLTRSHSIFHPPSIG